MIKVPTITTSVLHSTRNPTQSNQAEKKEIKNMKIRKEEVQLSLLADGMIYVENPQDPTEKLLELINEFR